MTGLGSCVGSGKIIYLQNVEAVPTSGPYSVATMLDGLVFTSGQLGLDERKEADRDTGQVNGPMGGDIERQTRLIMHRLQTILEKCGSDLDHVLKSTIYLTDLKDYALVNKIYGSFIKGQMPARTTIEVAGLPNNALIEIACIAVRKSP